MKLAARSPSRSRSDIAYQTIKDAILSNELIPGSPVSEEEWAGKLGMSRTPVREALARLEHEKLVRRVPNHGMFVADLSIDDFLEICEIRGLLEGNACRLAASRASKADIANFESEFKKLLVSNPTDRDVRRANEVDKAFHMFILEAAGNRQVVSIIAHFNEIITRLRFALTPSRYEESIREHQQILAALKEGNGEAAAAAMQKHMNLVSMSLHHVRSGRPMTMVSKKRAVAS